MIQRVMHYDSISDLESTIRPYQLKGNLQVGTTNWNVYRLESTLEIAGIGEDYGVFSATIPTEFRPRGNRSVAVQTAREIFNTIEETYTTVPRHWYVEVMRDVAIAAIPSLIINNVFDTSGGWFLPIATAIGSSTLRHSKAHWKRQQASNKLTNHYNFRTGEEALEHMINAGSR